MAAADSAPALIYSSPVNPERYLVINSGLTVAWADWAGDFPTARYGDFAIFKVMRARTIRKLHTPGSSTNLGNCNNLTCYTEQEEAAECRR